MAKVGISLSKAASIMFEKGVAYETCLEEVKKLPLYSTTMMLTTVCSVTKHLKDNKHLITGSNTQFSTAFNKE